MSVLKVNGTWMTDFCAERTRYRRRSPLNRHLRKLCKEVGVRCTGWHLLRHTFASRLAARGVPIFTIQKLLGHSTVLMTERYAHLAPSSFQDAVMVLDQEPSARTVMAPGWQHAAELAPATSA